MLLKDILKIKGGFVYTVNENDQICKVLDAFVDKKIGSCMVEDSNNDFIGIMTEKDAIKCFKDVQKFSDIVVKDIMTKYEDIIIASEDDNIQYAMGIMTEKRIKHLPIMKDSKIIGVISIGDIVKAQLEQSEHIAKTYLDHIKGKTPQPHNQEY
ncbi:MAG: CBS domain-containing protein [Candidatus Cloacimonetes bacterium]|nr:CBS domain-containing protein [Candidatus Cloacimonadota bacterium]